MYYTHDRHGNTTTLTNHDGQPTTHYPYTDYGTPTTTHTPGHTPAAEHPHQSTPPHPQVGDASYQPFQYAGEYTTPTSTQHLATAPTTPPPSGSPPKTPHNSTTSTTTPTPTPSPSSTPPEHTANSDTIINGVIIGLGGGIRGVVRVALPATTAGDSLGILVTLSVGIAADIAATGIATARIIDDKAIDFINDTHSEQLGYAEIGFGIAGMIAGATGFALLGRHLAKATQLKKAANAKKPSVAPRIGVLRTYGSSQQKLTLELARRVASKGTETTVLDIWQDAVKAQGNFRV